MRFYLTLLLNICELSAVVAGFLNWKKIKNTYWKWFPIFLTVIFIVEMTGKYLTWVAHKTNWNIAMYFYFGIPLQFLFYFWLFGKQGVSKAGRSLSITSILIYIISVAIEALYLRETDAWFSSFSYTIGSFLLTVLIINFLLNFSNTDEILRFKQSNMFWVSIGLAIFFIGSLPFYALRNTLANNYKDIFINYYYIQFIFDCLMYIVFALSFIWGKPK